MEQSSDGLVVSRPTIGHCDCEHAAASQQWILEGEGKREEGKKGGRREKKGKEGRRKSGRDKVEEERKRLPVTGSQHVHACKCIKHLLCLSD